MTTALKIRDFLDLGADTELRIFLKTTKSKTTQMRYDEFVKHSLEKFQPIMRAYMEKIDGSMKSCAIFEDLQKLEFPKYPPEIVDEVVTHMDKQKLLNIVEKTYLCLDLLRAVSGQIQTLTEKALLHYGNAFKAAANLTGSGGGRILGLNGRPLK
jgi:mevalonate kinase